jgi:hypothetical protein
MTRDEESSTVDGMPIRRQRVFLDGNRLADSGRADVDRTSSTAVGPKFALLDEVIQSCRGNRRKRI